MKEIRDIIRAFDAASKQGKKTALATVVHVQGSSYRRAGARMLITEDGDLTGAISGGCLEGDALRKALLAINEGKNKLVTYDTTDEDDAKLGIQLGCNGIVHILFEPLSEKNSHLIQLLRKATEDRQKSVLATLFNLNRSSEQPGTYSLYSAGRFWKRDLISDALNKAITQQLFQAMEEESSFTKDYRISDVTLTCLFEFIQPPVALMIAGAGNDAIPLADMANLLGWEVSIFDGRPAYANSLRFPTAKQVIIAKPEQVLSQLKLDPYTVFVLMSHNYNYDLAMLELLLVQEFSYVGVLGPRKKLERMLNEISEKGLVIDEDLLQKVFGPVGLDIGAETAEEIALSILAEIKTLLSKRVCMHLRDKKTSIHQPTRVSIMDQKDHLSLK